MTKTQREYWKNLIEYITVSQDVIRDLIGCDGDYEGAKVKEEERLKHLTDNYILRKKPREPVLFPQKKRKHSPEGEAFPPTPLSSQ